MSGSRPIASWWAKLLRLSIVCKHLVSREAIWPQATRPAWSRSAEFPGAHASRSLPLDVMIPRMASSLEVAELAQRLRSFAAEREWKQYHNPKNLAMALSVEAGELVECFQWLTLEEAERVMDDPVRARAVSDELADVLKYLVTVADELGVDLAQAVETKMEADARRYPPTQVSDGIAPS
jgi:dCTP diphosphatase